MVVSDIVSTSLAQKSYIRDSSGEISSDVVAENPVKPGEPRQKLIGN